MQINWISLNTVGVRRDVYQKCVNKVRT